MGRPREHGTRTEAELLAAAGRLLAGEGAAAVSVRRVAEAVGTTTRAVYSLFGDKQGLLRALFRQAAQTMRECHEAVPRHEDCLQELLELALAYRNAALREANLYHLYLGGAVPDLQPNPEDLALAYRSLDRVMDTVTRAHDAGLFPGRDPAEIGRQLWALVHGLASLELCGLLGEPDTAERRWHDAVRAALHGYRVPPDRPATVAVEHADPGSAGS